MTDIVSDLSRRATSDPVAQRTSLNMDSLGKECPMKRLHAVWRWRSCAPWFLVALSVPFGTASAVANEWGGSPQGDVAYVLCNEGSNQEVPCLDLPMDESPCGGGNRSCTGSCGYDCRTEEHLLGNGWRASLAECGILADMQLTQFYQGVASGGERQDFDYGGKLDYFFTFDGQKLGLWEGLSAVMHAETRFGEDVNLDAVGFAPVNANMLYPSPFEDETAITGLLVNQALSEELMVSAGKFNLFDLFAQIYPQTGRGITGFMNVSSFAPLAVARTLNLSTMGAGVTTLKEGQVQSTVAVVDTHNSTTTSGFDDLFDNGAVIVGYYRLFTNYGGLPGSHAILGTYSSGTYTSLDPLTWVILPNVGVVAGQETGSWCINYIYEKKLWVDDCNPQRNIDLLSGWGIADPTTSPYDWNANVAIQAAGLNARRPADTMGVAYFFNSLSSDFKNLLNPVLPVHDVPGVELYYNAAVTPWFHLTGDFQVVEPASIANDTAVVVGLRANFSL